MKMKMENENHKTHKTIFRLLPHSMTHAIAVYAAVFVYLHFIPSMSSLK